MADKCVQFIHRRGNLEKKPIGMIYNSDVELGWIRHLAQIECDREFMIWTSNTIPI